MARAVMVDNQFDFAGASLEFAAAFVACDHARTITATEINMTCGTVID